MPVVHRNMRPDSSPGDEGYTGTTKQEIMQALKNMVVQGNGLTGSGIARACTQQLQQVEVQVELEIRRVFHLDTRAQTFGAQLRFCLTWELPENERKPRGEPGWVPSWTPLYRIKSLLHELQYDVLYDVTTVKGINYVVAEARHRVIIFEHLKLKSFPHDCEQLTIELESTQPADLVSWKPALGRESVSLDVDRCHLDDFVFADLPYTWKVYRSNSASKKVYCLKTSLKVKRLAWYYLINVAFVLFVLGSLMLCSWSIHPSNLEARFEVDFTLILTVIAYKLVISDMLPRMSYMTQLDRYVMGSFIFLTLATVTHALLPLSMVSKAENSPLTRPPNLNENEDKLIATDMLSCYVFSAVWSLFNITFFCHFFWSNRAENRKFIALASQERIDWQVVQSEMSDVAPSR